MRTIYVHDRVVFLGGAESMLERLIRRFGNDDETKLFVFYSAHTHFVVEGKKIAIVTALPTWINQCFVRGGSSQNRLVRRLFDYRNLMPFYPVLCRLLRQKIMSYHPDQVIISSFAAAKNVVPPTGWSLSTTLYAHSPMQYIRENYEEYIGKLSGIKKKLFMRAAGYLRPRDAKPRQYTTVYANSDYTKQCLTRYYGLLATSWYPPLAAEFFHTAVCDRPQPYLVYVGRLVRFIREVDRIIDLCNQTKTSLIIVGSGPDEAYLKQLAGPTIIFVGQVDAVDEKIQIMKQARGLINLAKESCGIATMEALSLGVPVFGYAQGGSYELVTQDDADLEYRDGVVVSEQGVLVEQKDPELLARALRIFLTHQRDRAHIQQKSRTYLKQKATPR